MSVSVTNYLDRAVASLRSLGIAMPAEQGAPVVALLDKVAKYDNTKVTAIAATLQQSSAFNAAIRDQIKGMDIAARYADVTAAFDSIRDDAQQMAEWMADGKLDFKERIQLGFMKLRRGSIPDRFTDIRKSYLEVAKSANDQISRESTILEGYQDFRMAMKAGEVQAQELLNVAAKQLDERKAALTAASGAVDTYAGTDAAERARLEMARDEALRALQDEDKSYQIVKDIADNLKTGYSTAELVFARIKQTHDVKERLYQRMVSFFATNEVVLTGLESAFNSSAGLAEATNTMDAMTTGMNKGIEALATTGAKQLEAGLRAGYGSTLQVSSVKALADGIVQFQMDSQRLIEELRKEASQTATEIEAATEDGKRRFVALLSKGA